MTNLVANGPLNITLSSPPKVFSLQSLPKDFILQMIGYLSAKEQKVFRLVGRQMHQLVNEYPNFACRKLFQERLPGVWREIPQRWLENEKVRTTYEESCRVLENLKKRNFHYTAVDIKIPDHALCYFQAGYQRLYACYTQGQVSIWEKSDTFQCGINLPETGASIYNLESTEDYLTVAFEDGQLEIWKKDQDDRFHWLQKEKVGILTTIFATANFLFTQAGIDQPLHLWKRSKQGRFQVIQTIEHVQRPIFMDDFFAVWIEGVGLEVRSEERLLKAFPVKNPQFWLAGPYLCLYTEEGLEIWKKIGEKLMKQAVLPLKDGISDVTIWENHLCVQYYKIHCLLLFEIFNKFNLARTLKTYTNYFLYDEALFAERDDGQTFDIWQKKGLFIHKVQTISLQGRLTELILYHQTLFVLINDTHIQMLGREPGALTFKKLKDLRNSGTKIEDLLFKGGCLIAQTVEGKVEIWDFTAKT
jgi:hypothetical protein